MTEEISNLHGDVEHMSNSVLFELRQVAGVPFVTKIQIVEYLAGGLGGLSEHFYYLRAPDTEYLFSERCKVVDGILIKQLH